MFPVGCQTSMKTSRGLRTVTAGTATTVGAPLSLRATMSCRTAISNLPPAAVVRWGSWALMCCNKPMICTDRFSHLAGAFIQSNLQYSDYIHCLYAWSQQESTSPPIWVIVPCSTNYATEKGAFAMFVFSSVFGFTTITSWHNDGLDL